MSQDDEYCSCTCSNCSGCLGTEPDLMAPLLREAGPADAGAALRAVVEAKIRENHAGATISYDLAPTPMQGADGTLGGAYFLILSVRSPLLSPPRIATTFIIADAYPTDAQVNEAVKACLATLHEAREQLLRGGPGGGYHPGAN